MNKVDYFFNMVLTGQTQFTCDKGIFYVRPKNWDFIDENRLRKAFGFKETKHKPNRTVAWNYDYLELWLRGIWVRRDI